MAGIYIHIPFCKQACYYCDFHFSTSGKLFEELVECLKQEIAMQQNYLASVSVSTIYLGGGTPSLLEPAQLEEILSVVRDNFELSKQLEFTVEANPDDLTPDYLYHLRNSGVNRLSIGIQTFNPVVLKWMNRAHSSQQALNSIEWSREAGFENINVDLIYAVPLSDYSLDDDLSRLLDLKPWHISAYNLTIEPATVLGHRLSKGLINEVAEETAAEHFQIVMESMKSAGYHHYEISNFALPGKESRHNLGYWNGKPYLGIGPSAHSFNGDSRQHNISNNALYIKGIRDGRIPCSVEELSREDKLNEKIMLGLRTSDGLNLHIKTSGLEWHLDKYHPEYLQTLIDQGFALVKDNRLILTDSGKQIADRIAEDLFVIKD